MTEPDTTTEPRQRVTVEEALAAWEANGPTSLTVALMADALYGVRDALEADTTTEPLEKVRRPWGTIDPAEVKRLFDLGMPRREIAKRLNCHESSLYRVLKKAAS